MLDSDVDRSQKVACCSPLGLPRPYLDQGSTIRSSKASTLRTIHRTYCTYDPVPSGGGAFSTLYDVSGALPELPKGPPRGVLGIKLFEDPP